MSSSTKALARAVYARRQIVMLDDSFSGLDTVTEDHVFNRLCGENGIFGELNTTVLLVSSSGKTPHRRPASPRPSLLCSNLFSLTAKRLPYADHIICLGEKGRVVAQGSFADLNNAGGYVAAFSLPKADWDYDPSRDGGDDHDILADSDHLTSTSPAPPTLTSASIPSKEDLTAAYKTSGDTVVPRHMDQGSGSASFTGSNDTTHDHDHEKESTSNRQTGDLQIYLYYVRSVGWWTSLVFIAAITGFVFCISFPSK